MAPPHHKRWIAAIHVLAAAKDMKLAAAKRGPFMYATLRRINLSSPQLSRFNIYLGLLTDKAFSQGPKKICYLLLLKKKKFVDKITFFFF